jgi:hypothetical protein
MTSAVDLYNVSEPDVMPTLRVRDPHSSGAGVRVESAVRRLTPRECERLQGFPDDWTATSSGRAQADSARYRQLGNAVAVPVIAWVARRLAAVHASDPPTNGAHALAQPAARRAWALLNRRARPAQPAPTLWEWEKPEDEGES